MVSFRKMHGLGNDFVVIDARAHALDLTQEVVRGICDRHFGVGCDQLVVLKQSSGAVDVQAIFYNSDGSISGACGNATRCIADIVLNETGAQRCVIETQGGDLHAWRAESGMISVDMGLPRLDWADVPLAHACDTLHLPLDGDPVAVGMGNPHCVFFAADSFGDDYVEKHGSAIETNALFPERTNVEFVHVTGINKVQQKTWERGAGVTLACGTGACAVAVAAVRRGLVDRAIPVEVQLAGGALYIEWRADDNHVIMTGPVSYVFDGLLKNVEADE